MNGSRCARNTAQPRMSESRGFPKPPQARLGSLDTGSRREHGFHSPLGNNHGAMVRQTLNNLSREELETEVLRLRAALHDAGLAPPPAPSSNPCGDVLSTAPQIPPAASMRTTPATLTTDAARQLAIFESAIEFAIVLTDPAGIITDWNSGAVHVMGWSAEEMQGRTTEPLFTQADRLAGRVEEEMKGALRHGRVSDERWHLRKDGQQFWASGEMMPLHGDDGAHLGFMKILRDRTREHLAGQAIEEAKERYRLAAKATSDAVWDWDLQANHVLWNEALEDAYGHPWPAWIPAANGGSHRSIPMTAHASKPRSMA